MQLCSWQKTLETVWFSSFRSIFCQIANMPKGDACTPTPNTKMSQQFNTVLFNDTDLLSKWKTPVSGRRPLLRFSFITWRQVSSSGKFIVLFLRNNIINRLTLCRAISKTKMPMQCTCEKQWCNRPQDISIYLPQLGKLGMPFIVRN